MYFENQMWLDNTGSYLLLDASSSNTQVGILSEGQWLTYHSTEKTALEGLFTGMEKCLEKMSYMEINGFLFCEGPGSVLGMRLAAMIIRAWRAVTPEKKWLLYGYHSLVLAASKIETHENPYPFHILSASYRNYWNLLSCPTPNRKQWSFGVVSVDKLTPLKETIWFVSQRKSIPPPALTCSLLHYDFAQYAYLFYTKKLLSELKEPDVLQTPLTSYQKWTPSKKSSSPPLP